MITVKQYFMGRDRSHAGECTQPVHDAAWHTVDLVNQALAAAALSGVQPGVDASTGCAVASGWRPAAVNECTSNAACHSTHITAQGCDIRDTPDRAFARWCLRNQDALERIGLWMEDPRWTPSWVHLQTVPPRSGLRVYRPSMQPPKALPLPEQGGVTC